MANPGAGLPLWRYVPIAANGRLKKLDEVGNLYTPGSRLPRTDDFFLPQDRWGGQVALDNVRCLIRAVLALDRPGDRCFGYSRCWRGVACFTNRARVSFGSRSTTRIPYHLARLVFLSLGFEGRTIASFSQAQLPPCLLNTKSQKYVPTAWLGITLKVQLEILWFYQTLCGGLLDFDNKVFI